MSTSIEAVARSYEAFGQRKPIVARRLRRERNGFPTGEVIAGNHQLQAAKSLGWTHIAVVFTDIEMPGSMDGMKLAHVVRLGWPPILIVVASGRVMPREGELPENVQYIRKPYRAAEVIAAFRPTA